MLHQPLTDEEFILLTIEDDTKEAPWMVMGDPQITATSNFFIALRAYGRRRKLPWYVGSMLPILFPRPGTRVKGKLAPDVFVAFVEDRPRQSYDIEEEGGCPPFVLEVLSPESTARDLELKVTSYGGLGAKEYAVFAPTAGLMESPLRGYQQDPTTGLFVDWKPDENGCLFSTVLNLRLIAEGPMLRAQEPGGALLPMYEALEAENARLRAQLENRREG